MSLFAMIAVLAVILFISDATKKTRKAEPKKQSKDIVGHTSAMEERPAIKQRKVEKPMATPLTPQLDPVFLKEEDWSGYDQPSFLRKKNDAEGSPKKEAQAPTQKSKKSPKQSMQEFKANNRPKPGPAKEASYEEI